MIFLAFAVAAIGLIALARKSLAPYVKGSTEYHAEMMFWVAMWFMAASAICLLSYMVSERPPASTAVANFIIGVVCWTASAITPPAENWFERRRQQER